MPNQPSFDTPLPVDDASVPGGEALPALERRAHRRVRLKLGFATHALVFVLVNLGLYTVSAWTGGARGRALPLWGWGLGLAIHGAVVLANLYGEGLRARMLQSEIDRLRRRA